MLICDSGHAEARGGKQAKKPLAQVVEAPDSILAHPRQRLQYIRCPYRRSCPPSLGSPFPSGQGGEHQSHKWLPYVALPVASIMSRSTAICFLHRLIRKYRPYPPLVVYAPMRTLWAVCFCDNPSTPPHAS
jgi:hypothetical protein